MKRLKVVLLLVLIAVIPTIIVWAPFYLGLEQVWGIPIPKGGMQVIASNYDGPLYIVVAKSLYNKETILHNFSFPLSYEYYAAHFPLYPLIIKAIGMVTGNIWGMLIATLIGNIFATYFFFLFIKKYVSTEGNAIWASIVFAILPARWLIVKSVGAPESLFVGAIIASMYYFQKKNYLLAGIFGALAQATKSPAILLFVAYAIALTIPQLRKLAIIKSRKQWLKEVNFNAIFIALIPLSLVIVFLGYKQTFGDFLAYFHSGDNIHLFFPPFQIFNYSLPWVNTHWLEEIIFIYLVGALGFIKLLKKKDWALASFVGVFFATILFVSHRDLMRYTLPIIPFLIAAYAKTILKPEFKWVFLLLIIPVFLFSLAFISNNIMPVSDWGPLL